MRKTLLITALLPASAFVTMGQDSCSTDETVNTPDEQSDTGPKPSEGGGSSDGAEADDGGGAPKVANVGDSLTLEGASDERMQVTVQKVLDPAPAGEFDEPSKGMRYVGVQVALKNVGDAQYDDSPSNGAVLLTANDEQAQSAIVIEGPCAGSFGSSAKIAPGARQQGCIPFEVPNGAKLKTFQFTLSSGFGPQAGEWRLR